MIKKILSKELFILIFIVSIISFLLFWKLGTNYLSNWDEAWYADISRTMLRTNNFLTPFWNREPFFEKPPLYFWFSLLQFKLFGISEFSVRLTSVISALGIVFVVYFFAKQFLTKNIGLISLIILFSSIGFLYRSRTGNLDTLLTFFMTSAVFFFFKAMEANRQWFIALGMSLGLGFLSKGFIAFYPFIVILLFLVLSKKFNILKDRWFLLGIFAAFSISGGWFLLFFLVNGQQFVDQFLLANTEKFGFSSNPFNNFSLDYFGYLKNGLKIWLPLVIFSFGFLLIKIKNKFAFFLLIYSSFFLFIISFSHEKSNWFVLPLYPILSLITGYGVLSLIELRGKKLKLFSFICLIVIALFQLFIYRESYIVPNVSSDEVKSAFAARKLTAENQPIYLTNYYYPTTAYYSERKVYALYSDSQINTSWWIKSKDYWTYVFKDKNVVIITTKSELKELREKFPLYRIDILFSSGDKIVAKKV